MRPTFSIVTLGCPRNFVDSQYLVAKYLRRGWEYTSDPYSADYVIINTCGFIRPAVEESVNAILEFEEALRSGRIKGLWVVGCLVERYGEELRKEFPGLRFQGCVDPRRLGEVPPVVFAEGGYAYVKICEGCLSRCSFCTIPQIRGRLRSRPMEEIIEEVKYITSQLGKSEVVLVGQDTTAYGWDLYRGPRLKELVKGILTHTEVRWLRLMYAYPGRVDEELLDLIARDPRLLKYLDVPIQHVSERILGKMARGYGKGEVETLFRSAEERGIGIRTTVIVGFPGEGRKEFGELRRFLEGQRSLIRLGVFRYYPEEGTPAHRMRGRPKESTVISRYRRIRRISREVLRRVAEEMAGKEVDVIVDGYLPSAGYYLARTQWDAPEVDNVVFLHSEEELFSGDIVKARLELKNEELIGEVAVQDTGQDRV